MTEMNNFPQQPQQPFGQIPNAAPVYSQPVAPAMQQPMQQPAYSAPQMMQMSSEAMAAIQDHDTSAKTSKTQKHSKGGGFLGGFIGGLLAALIVVGALVANGALSMDQLFGGGNAVDVEAEVLSLKENMTTLTTQSTTVEETLKTLVETFETQQKDFQALQEDYEKTAASVEKIENANRPSAPVDANGVSTGTTGNSSSTGQTQVNGGVAPKTVSPTNPTPIAPPVTSNPAQ